MVNQDCAVSMLIGDINHRSQQSLDLSQEFSAIIEGGGRRFGMGGKTTGVLGTGVPQRDPGAEPW